MHYETYAVAADAVLEPDCIVAGFLLLKGRVPVTNHCEIRRQGVDDLQPFTLEHTAHRARLPVALQNAGTCHRVEVEKRLYVLFAIDMWVVVEARRHEQAVARWSSEPRDKSALDPIVTDVARGRRRAHTQRDVRLGHMCKTIARRAQLLALKIDAYEAGGGVLAVNHGAVGAILLFEFATGTRWRAQPREQIEILLLGKLRQLIESDKVELGRCVAVTITRPLEMPEAECGATCEAPALLRFIPVRVIAAAEPGVRAIHQRVGHRQVGNVAPDDEGVVTGHIAVLERRH